MLKEDGLVRPFVGDSFGYRANLRLLTDGRMRLDGSGGASAGTCEIYRIGADGFSLDLEEAYYWDDQMGRNDYYEGTHRYISSGEFGVITADHQEIDILSVMDWNEI